MKMKNIGMVACGLCLMTSINVQAKPTNLGDYSRAKTEIRGEDKDEARSGLMDAIEASKTKQDNRKQLVLGVFKDGSGSDLGYKVSADSVMIQSVKSVLNTTVEFVDSERAEAVQKDLERWAETGGEEDLGVLDLLADFTVFGEVLSMSAGKEWFPSEIRQDKEGKKYRIPEKCRVTANAEVTLSFYTLNPFRLESTITSKGNSSDIHEHVASCRSTKVTNNVVTAIKEAVTKKDQEIQNVFFPSGLIIDHRADKKGKKHIFKTTLKTRGIVPKDSVTIFKIVQDEDPITGDIIDEKVVVGVGKVLAVSGEENVWVGLNKKYQKNAGQILLGDTVEIKKKRSAMGAFGKSFGNFMN